MLFDMVFATGYIISRASGFMLSAIRHVCQPRRQRIKDGPPLCKRGLQDIPGCCMLVSKVGGGTGRGAFESMAAANGEILRMTVPTVIAAIGRFS